jgi:hypothetical protein
MLLNLWEYETKDSWCKSNLHEPYEKLQSPIWKFRAALRGWFSGSTERLKPKWAQSGSQLTIPCRLYERNTVSHPQKIENFMMNQRWWCSSIFTSILPLFSYEKAFGYFCIFSSLFRCLRIVKCSRLNSVWSLWHLSLKLIVEPSLPNVGKEGYILAKVKRSRLKAKSSNHWMMNKRRRDKRLRLKPVSYFVYIEI